MPSRIQSTLFLPFTSDQRFPYTLPRTNMFQPLYPITPHISQQSSFMRSSAQNIPTSSQQSYYPNSYAHAAPLDPYPEELSSSVSSTESVGIPASLSDHAQDISGGHYALTATAAAQPYTYENTSRSFPWAQEEFGYSQLQDSGYDAGGRLIESPIYQHTFFDKAQEPYTPPELPPFYQDQAPAMSSEQNMAPYTVQNTVPAGLFSGSPHLTAHGMMQDQSSSPASSYSTDSPHLQYIPTPPPCGINPQCVNLQQISPSPEHVNSNLPSPSASQLQLSTTYAVAEPLISTDDDSASDVSSTPVAPRRATKARTSSAPPRKRVKTEVEDPERPAFLSDSGESEREEDADDADDDDYQPEGRETFRPRRKTSSAARSVVARSESPAVQRPRVPPPVPVPNLTKKSRGRHVPTASEEEDVDDKTKRGYKCKVDGCNKLFQRGEHLKRHVRSIHTNEKPHKCPYKLCGKDFSRHDNLRQHMRVHRNDPLDSEGTAGSA